MAQPRIDLVKAQVGFALCMQRLCICRKVNGRGRQFRLPKLRPYDRLAAMVKGFLDANKNCEFWNAPADCHRFAQLQVAHNLGAAIDADDLISVRDQKDDAYLACLKDVLEAVKAVIAWAVWDCEGLGIYDFYETSGVAFGRGVKIAVLINCGHDDEWTAFYPDLTMGVDVIEDFEFLGVVNAINSRSDLGF